MREHGMTPQNPLGSVGSESAGDPAWQRALQQLEQINERDAAMRARSN